VPAGFAVLNRIAQTRLRGRYSVTLPDLLFEGGDWLLYGLLTPAVFSLSKRLPLTRPRVARHALLHLALSLFFCVAWASGGKLLQLGLELWFAPNAVRAAFGAGRGQLFRAVGVDWLSWVFTTLPFGVAVYLCVVGIEHAIRYFIEARERDVQLARLSEQLSGARFAALQAQVNPHFLFNTLNTITVLVRDNERLAAVRIVEQSNILRSLLRKHDAFCNLSEEIAFIDDYLDIEVIRFGEEKLHVHKELDPDSLDCIVPSMLLQPLVENAIKHGLSSKIDGGNITLRSQLMEDKLLIQVEDDGVGMEATGQVEAAGLSREAGSGQGIGMSNVADRLKVLYGDAGKLSITPPPSGHGTLITLELPLVETELARSAADKIYSERSRTRA